MKKISIEDLYFLLVVLIFLKPQICEDIPILDISFNALRFIWAILYGGIVIVKSTTYSKINKDLVLLWTLFIVVFIATMLVGKNYPKALTHYIPSIGLCSFLYYYRARIIEILTLLENLGIILLVTNLVSYFMFPDGILYRSENNLKIWILGQKQDLGGFTLCFIFVSAYLCLYNKEVYGKKFNIIFGLSFSSALLEKAIGLLLCLTVLFVLVMLDKYITKIKRSMLIIAIIIGIIFLVYVCYNIENLYVLQNLLSNIGYDGISKLRTANIRFGMWKFAFDTVKAHPIIGVGNLTIDIWNNYTSVGYHSMLDNMYFDVLLTGGIVGIALFSILIKRNFNYCRKIWTVKEGRLVGYCIFALYLLLMESCPYTPAVFMILTSQIWAIEGLEKG